MIKVGIAGGAGYTGGELIRILLGHPETGLVFVNSESHAGALLAEVHEGLWGDTDMRFTDELPLDEVDVLFFCFGHGKSEAFLHEHHVPERVKIIDLAQDFRLVAPRQFPAGASNAELSPQCHDFVYGLPEINRAAIAKARHVANPGCFATCIQLALLPAAALHLVKGCVSVNAITGSTGAGQRPAPTTHFSWRNGNMSIYKAFRHQHVPEIRQSLAQVQGSLDASIDFIPYRGDFARGIFATAVIHSQADPDVVLEGYRNFYRQEPFTHYVDAPIDMKQVVNTNKCLVHCDCIDGKLLVTSCIDNLLKGAVGQAVENMNLMFGINERTGLQLKASAF